MAFGVGAVATLVAFVLGITIVRPGMERATALSQEAATLPAPDRDAQLARAQALRQRAGKATRWVASLLTISAGAMAVARYL